MTRVWKNASKHTVALACSLAMACAQQSGNSPASSQRIDASGGELSLGTELNFSVPPGSLEGGAEIGVERLAQIPTGDADGFQSFGQAYQFTPSGTTFSLGTPARLTINADMGALAQKGLDPRTLQIFYFDETLKRFVNVASQADPADGTVTASVEHFTVYLPMARALVPGNLPPVVAVQATVPSPLRAAAPMMFRATARDYTTGGSIAGVKLFYRFHGAATYASLQMRPDLTPNVIDTWAAVVPASFFPASATSTSPNFDYYIEATDNLGAITDSAVQTLSIAHAYQQGTLAVVPTSLTVASGFTKLFTATGKDETNAVFPLIPESVTVNNGVGTVTAPTLAGAAFTAGQEGSGAVTVSISSDPTPAIAPVTVFTGALASISILGPGGTVPTGTLNLKEGMHYSFDVVGHDEFGNTIPVLPSFTVDPGIGTLDANGNLYTLDGAGYGALRATLGAITAEPLWINVQVRTWQPVGPGAAGYNNVYIPTNSITLLGTTPYVGYSTNGVTVSHFDGTSWITDLAYNDGSGSVAVAACGEDVWATWVLGEGTGNDAAYVQRITNGPEMPVLLNGDPTHKAAYPSIACNGSLPAVSWTETVNQIDSSLVEVLVKQFDGTNWNGIGGAVTTTGTALAGIPISSLAFSGGVPYVATDVASSNANGSYEAWTLLKFGGDWTAVISPTCGGSTCANEHLAITGTTAYIAHTESGGHIAVEQIDLTGMNLTTEWGIEDATYDSPPSIALDGATPYVTWTEQGPPVFIGGMRDPARIGDGPCAGMPGPFSCAQDQLIVRHLGTDGTWHYNGSLGSIPTPAGSVAGPAIAIVNSTPFVSFYRLDATPFPIFVKELQ